MLLIFGGTTEGRSAAAVCEEAGKPFFYATRGSEQAVELANGQRLTGAMDVPAILTFCREHAIRLIVDAAHPFAEQLHRNLLRVAEELKLPLVRYDRIYPPHTSDIIWCRDYDDAIARMEAEGIERLLALTGVQTIGRLRPFWQKHECWFRILDRDSSRAIAAREGFPKERLIEIKDERLKIKDEASQSSPSHLSSLISNLSSPALLPDAIITKESGISGGFMEKVEAAKAAGLKIFAVERPPLNFNLSSLNSQLVNGPHGLRRAIEALLPDFFPLHTGLTTGTCATAAVVAATLQLLTGEQPSAVPVTLSNGETITVPVSFADGNAFCVKDFSDDPDVTRGCRIMAKVAFAQPPASGIRFLQGEGVGRVTLPGLGIPVGEPAINPTPRRCITEAIRALTDAALDVTISVENGRELAERTFNSRVGVVDGISIIGTTGIVKPLSNDAFVESIGRELQVARAIGCDCIGLASGKKGEEALLSAEPTLRVIHYGNFIGAALTRAYQLGFRRVVLGIMLGKAVKLAEGHLDTHSHKVLMNKAFLADVARQAGVSDAEPILDGITMARELWALMPPAFFTRLQALCTEHCRTVFPDGELDIRIIQHE